MGWDCVLTLHRLSFGRRSWPGIGEEQRRRKGGKRGGGRGKRALNKFPPLCFFVKFFARLVAAGVFLVLWPANKWAKNFFSSQGIYIEYPFSELRPPSGQPPLTLYSPAAIPRPFESTPKSEKCKYLSGQRCQTTNAARSHLHLT